MRFSMQKAVAAAVVVGAAAFATGGTALAVERGQIATGTGVDNTEGGAYSQARDNARNQCPDRNNVTLVSRDTQQQGGRWTATVSLRCN